ncbi:hypothetical protein HRG_009705 [Hirsutella rhossiliensis]|uniref:Uncharacterized protein n=1 Tax=Hirsutella rhossiliensis TaxID=111463 RepID=A0A9P8MQD3_9HYPO|nr:uncharacterized protein HRG_09705 [Hirsutella rhossiliensis]KAH0959244.1 hypothetical protein HRG_09705 [Hirsutella rhossiliensis]
MLSDAHGEEQAAYRKRIIRYVDSVFCEDLDQEGLCAVQAERSVTSDVSSLVDSAEQFSAAFKKPTSAPARRRSTPITRHASSTPGQQGAKGRPLSLQGALEAGRENNVLTGRRAADPWPAGRWGGCRNGVVGDDGTEKKTRQFLMRAVNRVFTERALSQVEVVAHLLVYPSEFTSGSIWAYLNVESATNRVTASGLEEEEVPPCL